jgi:hypothetical protein
MYAEDLIATLMQAPALVQATGGRIALVQLPQDVGYPAIAYSIISDNPLGRMCKPGQAYKARVQINPLAVTVRAMLDLHTLVRQTLENYAPQTVGTLKLQACVYEGMGSTSKDDLTGAWTKPADYFVIYEAPPTPPAATE